MSNLVATPIVVDLKDVLSMLESDFADQSATLAKYDELRKQAFDLIKQAKNHADLAKSRTQFGDAYRAMGKEFNALYKQKLAEVLNSAKFKENFFISNYSAAYKQRVETAVARAIEVSYEKEKQADVEDFREIAGNEHSTLGDMFFYLAKQEDQFSNEEWKKSQFARAEAERLFLEADEVLVSAGLSHIIAQREGSKKVKSAAKNKYQPKKETSDAEAAMILAAA